MYALDLNKMIADVCDKQGEQNVTESYHVEPDKIHTSKEGATLSTFLVAKAL